MSIFFFIYTTWKHEFSWRLAHVLEKIKLPSITIFSMFFFSSHYPRRPDFILNTEQRPRFPNVCSMNYTNGRRVFVCQNQCLSDVVGIAWSHSGAVSREYKARVLSTRFSIFIHTNLLWKCVCSQGFYELEAKFTALDSNHADWGTNDDLLELFFSHSKVKKNYMKRKAFNNLPWNPVLIILNVGVTILCMMCAVTQLTLKEHVMGHL